MRKALILITYCTEAYPNDFTGILYKIEASGLYKKEKNGFCADDLKVKILNSNLIDANFNEELGRCIFLFHNNLTKDEIGQEVIDYLNNFDKILLIKHNNNKSGINSYIENSISEKSTLKVISKSHTGNSNPFYRLKEFWEDGVNFDEKFNEFEETFFQSDDEVEDEKLLNLKLTFLHKLLGGQQGLEDEYYKFREEYDNLPKFPSKINNEFIKKVRDIILDKEI